MLIKDKEVEQIIIIKKDVGAIAIISDDNTGADDEYIISMVFKKSSATKHKKPRRLSASK